MSRRALPSLLVGLALLVGCADDGPANDPDPGVPTGTVAAVDPASQLSVAELVTGLDVPWGLAPLSDGSLLVSTRDRAEVLLVPGGDGEPRVVGTVDGVRAEGESGLLGLALASDERTLFAYRTGPTENGVVAMSWDGETLGDPEDVVTGIPGGATYHQGGGLVVGPDGLLYVSTGDNGVPEDAQDLDSLSGKVLRYSSDGSPAPGNPFGTAVYSTGHRNVEGLVFDDDGRLWAAEFGQDRFDELNLVEAGSDYGWPEVEGTGGPDADAAFVDPAVVWSTADASPSGLAWWGGSLWLAGLRGETLWEVPVVGGEATRPVAHLREEYGRIRNAVARPDGDGLWVVTSNTDGRGEPDGDDDLLLGVSR